MSNEILVPVCGRCKKPIVDVAYIEVSGAVVLQNYFNKEVPLYRCVEHAANYAMRTHMHADCWIDTLKDHGVKLHDVTKILEERQKVAQELKNKQDSNIKKKHKRR